VSSAPPTRDDLAAEAIRLGRALAELLPDASEVHGLLAMMLLLDARRDARVQDGDLVLLEEQDRARWDAAGIAEGRAVLDRALALRGRGPYVVQAAIASLHADEPRDWPQIAALYGELTRLTGSPVVELSRAVAVAELPMAAPAGGDPETALARALAQGADILLMDEPFGALDAMTRDLLHDEIERLWREQGLTILFVTHNVREAVRLGDRVVLLSSRPGRVVAEFPVVIPRPRRIESHPVADLASAITNELREEVRRHGDD